MNRDESRNELGSVRIHKNVISSISSIAALEIEGVKKVGANLKSSLLELVGQKSFLAIKVDISKNEEVKVEIPLVIKYGYNIPDTAHPSRTRFVGSPTRRVTISSLSQKDSKPKILCINEPNAHLLKCLPKKLFQVVFINRLHQSRHARSLVHARHGGRRPTLFTGGTEGPTPPTHTHAHTHLHSRTR